MAADRHDRVSLITGTLSVEAPPSNAAQCLHLAAFLRVSVSYFSLSPSLFQSFTFQADFSITVPPFSALKGYFGMYG